MSRWQPNAGQRLERAALDLFTERGFAQTTVPEITARAGLTTRTFFRHFADKREVLFAGDDELPEMAARLVAEAPAELSPMTVITQGLETFAEAVFEGQRETMRVRKTVIQSDAGLRERELQKLSALSEAIRDGFRARGVDGLTASLTAHIAMTVFSVAIGRWLDEEPEQPLAVWLHDTLRALRSLTAEPPV